MSKSKTSVSAAMVPQMAQGAILRGYTLEQLLISSQLPTDLCCSDDELLSYDQFTRLANTIANLLVDESLGLFCIPYSLGYRELLTIAMLGTENLRQAMGYLIAYSNRLNDGLRHELSADATQCRYTIEFEKPEAALNAFAVEGALLWRHRVACWLGNFGFPAKEVYLPHPEQEWLSAYPHMYPGANIFFEQDFAAFVFDSVHLNNPVLKTQSDIHELPGTAFALMPAESQRIGCLGIQVRSYVYENLIKSNEAPSLENAAEYVGLTSYTLHRRLKREGLSYKDLLAMARQQMAFILLREENTSIEDISTKLGYLEVSSFTRAFKSWTNKTPLSYRNDLFRCK